MCLTQLTWHASWTVGFISHTSGKSPQKTFGKVGLGSTKLTSSCFSGTENMAGKVDVTRTLMLNPGCRNHTEVQQPPPALFIQCVKQKQKQKQLIGGVSLRRWCWWFSVCKWLKRTLIVSLMLWRDWKRFRAGASQDGWTRVQTWVSAIQLIWKDLKQCVVQHSFRCTKRWYREEKH